MSSDDAEFYGSVDAVLATALKAWRPPPVLSLSQWAERHFYLSAESAAEPGRWKAYPFQVEIMDAVTDPRVERVTWMKSARVGYTKTIGAGIGYYIHQDPCPQLVVQPTIEDAKGYSKDEIAPMIRDCPELARIVLDEAEEAGAREAGNTIRHKKYPGGVLSLIGANSGSGFRRITKRVVWFDEVDAYPPSAGSDGDPIELGVKRTQTFWNRKIVAGSTPLLAGSSRIEAMFLEGDRRRFFVPCPSCGHMAPLVFTEDAKTGRFGHVMRWPKGKPEEAFFSCQQNGCVIEHKDKRAMVAGGEWRAEGEFNGHASFHIWAAYSFAANASWGQIAEEFVAANGNTEKLRTFVNTILGETWKEPGEAPDHSRLYAQRETYAIGTVPEGVRFLTAGLDVQKDRVVYEVVGWGARKESWSIDAGVIPFDTSNAAQWEKVDELLTRGYYSESGVAFSVRTLAADSGYNTQAVYNYARRHAAGLRVIAVKGVSTQSSIVGPPKAVDVLMNGRRIARGVKVWPVGVDMVKSELYGWLRLMPPDPGAPHPSGFCHFPQYDLEFFKQLTAEQHVAVTNKKTGFVTWEWRIQAGHENHQLDARGYARAAAFVLGLDRHREAPPTAAPAPAPAVESAPPPAESDSGPAPKVGAGIGNRVRTGWLSRRR